MSDIGREKFRNNTPMGCNYQALYDIMRDAVVRLDLDGLILGGNSSFEALFGYRPEELSGLSWRDIVSPKCWDLHQGILDLEVLPNGRSEIFEEECRDREKRVIPVSMRLILMRDENNNPLEVWGLVRDLRAQKQTEEALVRVQALLMAAFDQSTTGILVMDASTLKIVLANKSANELLHIPKTLPEEAVFDRLYGSAWQAFRIDGTAFLLEDLPVMRALRHGETSGSVMMRFNFSHENKDHWLVVNAAPIRGNDGEIIAAIVIFADVTQQRQAEDALRQAELRLQHSQKLESLGLLAGGIAHDFNNILLAVMGHTDLALSELSGDSPVKNHLQSVIGASRRAAELCRQMLAYAGRGRLVVEPLLLSEAVSEIAEMLKVSISKKISLRFDFKPGLPRISADISEVRQVIMNLVINAAEAIANRAGEIVVRTYRLDQVDPQLIGEVSSQGVCQGGYVVLEVEDTGCGMSKKTIDRIFDPFFTTKFTGRGLGLAAVLGIVRGHGGLLFVESEINRGTVFRILFPVAEECTENGLDIKGDQPQWSGRGTILLVDDEVEVRDVARSMLERLGFEVIVAGDGCQAISIFGERSEHIFCVILDLTMPSMDGRETLRGIKTINPKIPVVMTSGYSESEVSERFLGEGAAGFIQKPYSLETLAAKLQSMPAKNVFSVIRK